MPTRSVKPFCGSGPSPYAKPLPLYIPSQNPSLPRRGRFRFASSWRRNRKDPPLILRRRTPRFSPYSSIPASTLTSPCPYPPPTPLPTSSVSVSLFLCFSVISESLEIDRKVDFRLG